MHDRLIEHARNHATALQADMRWNPGDYDGGWWDSGAQLRPVIQARAVAALAFLDQVAGSGSQWAVRANQAYENKGDNQSVESGARAVGDLLGEWANQVETGWVTPLRTAEASPRAIASTDLMDHVRALNSDGKSVPAAPIVLAGAALEMALRGAAETIGLEPPTKPAMGTWAQALRTADVLTTQEMKDITQVAGLRNSAAHGQLDELSSERSGLCEQQVNLLLAKIEDRVRSHLDSR